MLNFWWISIGYWYVMEYAGWYLYVIIYIYIRLSLQFRQSIGIEGYFQTHLDKPSAGQWLHALSKKRHAEWQAEDAISSCISTRMPAPLVFCRAEIWWKWNPIIWWKVPWKIPWNISHEYPMLIDCSWCIPGLFWMAHLAHSFHRRRCWFFFEVSSGWVTPKKRKRSCLGGAMSFIWGFPYIVMGVPNSWRVYVMENPNLKWMMN